MNIRRKKLIAAVGAGLTILSSSRAFAAENTHLDILRQGLLGAGTGAISAYSSGGKAGKGALIGAGTGILGNLLFGLLGGSSASQPVYQPAPSYQPVYQQPVYQQPTYQQPAVQQPVLYQAPLQQPVYTTETVYVSPQPVYRRPTTDNNRQILRNGLLGAGVGAISAETSGGKAGQGALVGAGTNVIGGALLDLLTS